MYCKGLNLRVIGSFKDHDGFDGVMLGNSGMHYHFEFTQCHQHPVIPAPTAEDLVVFYVVDLEDWRKVCAAMVSAGFKQVASFNSYWDMRGRTFEDDDGYRVVLQNAAWENSGDASP
jgi:hypothetical protein